MTFIKRITARTGDLAHSALERTGLALSVLRKGAPLTMHGSAVNLLISNLHRPGLSQDQISEIEIRSIKDLLGASGGIKYSYDYRSNLLTETGHLGAWRSHSYEKPRPPEEDKDYFVSVCMGNRMPLFPQRNEVEHWFTDPESEPFALWIRNRELQVYSKDKFVRDSATVEYGANPDFVRDLLFFVVRKNHTSMDFIMLANWHKNAQLGRCVPIIRWHPAQIRSTLLAFRNACELAHREADERKQLELQVLGLRGIADEVHSLKNAGVSAGGFISLAKRALEKELPQTTATSTEEGPTYRYLRIAGKCLSEAEGMAVEIMKRLKTGQIEPKFQMQPVELCDIFKRYVSSAAPPLEKIGLTLKLDLPQTPVSILIDRAKFMNEIFVEIMMNAKKYTEKAAGAKKEITISIKLINSGRDVMISVKDSGIGIPPGQIAKIFSRGFRASNAGDIQGTGLGLCLIRTYIVTAFGGNAWIESEGEGKGTTFIMTFPVTAGAADAS